MHDLSGLCRCNNKTCCLDGSTRFTSVLREIRHDTKMLKKEFHDEFDRTTFVYKLYNNGVKKTRSSNLDMYIFASEKWPQEWPKWEFKHDSKKVNALQLPEKKQKLEIGRLSPDALSLLIAIFDNIHMLKKFKTTSDKFSFLQYMNSNSLIESADNDVLMSIYNTNTSLSVD